jgi:hypothetical protein
LSRFCFLVRGGKGKVKSLAGKGFSREFRRKRRYFRAFNSYLPAGLLFPLLRALVPRFGVALPLRIRQPVNNKSFPGKYCRMLTFSTVKGHIFANPKLLLMENFLTDFNEKPVTYIGFYQDWQHLLLME